MFHIKVPIIQRSPVDLSVAVLDKRPHRWINVGVGSGKFTKEFPEASLQVSNAMSVHGED